MFCSPRVVTEANVQDRAIFPRLLHKAKPIAPTITPCGWTKGYTGQTVTTVAAKAGVIIDIVSGPKPGHGFIVRPAAG